MTFNPLIYGKDATQQITGIEVKDDVTYIYTPDGIEKRDNEFYILTSQYDEDLDTRHLSGNNHYSYFCKFKTASEQHAAIRKCKMKGIDYWTCYNPVESAMLKYGYTMYKGMKLSDVSVLSFDIETTGVKINDDSYVLLISNTFRDRAGNIHRKLFSFDEYDSPKDFISAWCRWVRDKDPDIMLGHNIFGFDLPYLAKFAKNYNTRLNLGRDASPIRFQQKPRRFRKDGSQSYEYYNANIWGRELIDTFFLSIKYDVSRNYPSYALKAIIAHEGLEREDRQHYDAGQIAKLFTNPAEWAKIKKYAEHDADDALALFDLMAPQFFYYTQSIPKSFQQIINTATGSQVNSFMIRSYLQQGMAIPKADEKEPYEGAIAIGNPGTYKNVYKIDVASLYPSIMLQYNIYNPEKDPNRHFLEMVKYFTDERLENKRKAIETGDRYYKDLSNGQKIMINSAYGFMGAPGLNFNYPAGASEVTRAGRGILQGAISWANLAGCQLVNADTDSISYTNGNIRDIEQDLREVNCLSADLIKWENDGFYPAVLVVKAKNYALFDGDQVKIKGSALKATMKEPALKEFLESCISALLCGNKDYVFDVYEETARSILDIRDIKPWCSKKTITEKVLNPQRTNESRILDACEGENIQEGDKIHVFFESDTKLCLDKNFKGYYDIFKLQEKLYKTVKILEPVLDISKFKNYKLKKYRQDLLPELRNI